MLLRSTRVKKLWRAMIRLGSEEKVGKEVGEKHQSEVSNEVSNNRISNDRISRFSFI